MSTITAILTPSPDGTLHLPLPAAWRNQAIRVTAELEPVAAEEDAGKPLVTPKAGSLKGFGCLQGKLWMASDFDAPLEDFKDYME